MSLPTLHFSRHPQTPDPEDLKTSLRPMIIIHAVLAQLKSFQTLIALLYLLTYLLILLPYGRTYSNVAVAEDTPPVSGWSTEHAGQILRYDLRAVYERRKRKLRYEHAVNR